MKERNALLRAGCVIAALLLLACLLSGCGAEKAGITSIEQLGEAGRRIGVNDDTDDDKLVAQRFPGASIVHYRDAIAAYTAVKQGRLDAFVYAELMMETAIRNGMEGVRILDETLGESYTMAVGVSPKAGIPGLKEKIDGFLGEIQADGTLDEMRARWLVRREQTMPEIEAAENPGLHLVVGTSGTSEPFTFYVGNELRGFDIELAERFAAWLGASVEFKIYDYGGIVAAAQSGDIDCIFAALFVTPEREEALLFSEPTYVEKIAVMVRGSAEAPDASGQGGEGFLSGLLASFEKTFIRENRWKMFLEGVGTTLLIAALSIALGTLLGFGVFLLCRRGSPVANTITRFFVWLVQGMPVVVLLMILYYIVFGGFDVSGTAVSVVGFTLIFGAAVYEMVRAGVATVDRGQTEAAYALGYTGRRALFRVVLPQALPHIMPAYRAQITALIKATAVVGYVAVEDLTKMGDIVRSRTYDAFFPLIAVAVVYFILAAVLTFLVNRIEPRFDPRRRSQGEILRGVDTE